VSARLLITGTPGQVADDVKELIDLFADNGGLIIDSSMGLPDEARPENVEAMVETTFSYGKN
jgi:uroporphyrinogen-III decarboxylase